MHDPDLAPAVDETRWDLRRKKLFLFAPERRRKETFRRKQPDIEARYTPAAADTAAQALNEITLAVVSRMLGISMTIKVWRRVVSAFVLAVLCGLSFHYHKRSSTCVG